MGNDYPYRAGIGGGHTPGSAPAMSEQDIQDLMGLRNAPRLMRP